MKRELYHYRMGGEITGRRRYQYEDGSLTPEGRVHYGVGPPRNAIDKAIQKHKKKVLRRKDDRWLSKQSRTTTKKLEKEARNSKELKEYDKKLRSVMPTRNKDRSLNKNYVAKYNMALAEIMNKKASTLDNYSPSGMVLRFIAKRGEVGVHSAMATPNYDMSKVKRGVTADGKVAYKKEYVEQTSGGKK